MTKLRLVTLRKFNERDLSYLNNRLKNDFDLIVPTAFDDQTLTLAVTDAEAAIGGHISTTVLTAARRLKFLQNPGSGVNGLDLTALAARGIAVGNSHSNAPYVAETALSLALSLIRRTAINDRSLRAGRSLIHDRPVLGGSLIGSCVGFVGFGHVGQAIHRLLDPFGVQATAWVRRPRPDSQGIRFLPLPQVLANSDVIFVSLPATAGTQSILDAQAFRLCRPDAILINVGRAEVIDRTALLAALRDGRLGGAGLDVWWSDDIWTETSDFATLDNVILSPHQAGTHNRFATHLPGAVENLLAFARTGKGLDIVDPIAGY